MKKRILCYGDSNTWGYTPGSGIRYDENTRWTGILRQRVSDFAEIIEAGLNGRTTVFDDPINPYRNGLKGLGYTLITEKPLDLVVICLGINDLKFAGIAGAARGMEELLRTLFGANQIYQGSTPVFPNGPRVLLMAPPPLHPRFDELRPDTMSRGKSEESRRFAELYAPLAERYGAEFLDASAVATCPSEVDGLHLTAESHARLAEAVEKKLREICL